MPRPMLVTDLDGTLLDSHSRLSEVNRRCLERLGDAGVVRVIVTGRSLYSARKVLEPDMPIDFMAFSSGAGTVNWRSQELIDAHNMSAQEARRAVDAVVRRKMDFMLHHAVPDNHYFYFHHWGPANPDFDRRLERYREFGQSWSGSLPNHPLCQVVAIEPPTAPERYQELCDELRELTVILATSPLDHASRWIEIFPPQVSKSQAARSIAGQCGVSDHAIVAIGNDFNDRDLLQWARRSFVVANAPAELRKQYAVVASNDDDGFAQAASSLLET